MSDSKSRENVFKKNVLRRLYGDHEETETLTEREQDTSAPVADRICVTANYTCPVIPQKKVYTVTPKPLGVLSDKKSSLPVELEGPEFVEEEDYSESEEEEEVKRRRRRKRKQQHIDQTEGQRQKTESVGVSNQILTKNQKRKLKKKKRKEREKLSPGENKKGFTYSIDTSEDVTKGQNNCQREELCNKLPKLVEFVRAVWEVYNQDVKDSKHHEENFAKLLNQMASISDTEDETVLSEFNNLWHVKTLLILADHPRAEEKIKHLENTITVTVDKESLELLCILLRYWITDIANQT
ncbi:uncharacterized protein LOC132561199 [Ylistrum balloti]|uniref:uncharacterized protein LOC132561199 n=1 Tax=Ylistrum balloti TaxID=509963 RepID=UPI002905F795|nr:uncharacterized protein LOC132561199 [Ylistrum balloti]